MKKWKVVAQYLFSNNKEVNQVIINVGAKNKEELLQKTEYYFVKNFGNLEYKVVDIYEV